MHVCFGREVPVIVCNVREVYERYGYWVVLCKQDGVSRRSPFRAGSVELDERETANETQPQPLLLIGLYQDLNLAYCSEKESYRYYGRVHYTSMYHVRGNFFSLVFVVVSCLQMSDTQHTSKQVHKQSWSLTSLTAKPSQHGTLDTYVCSVVRKSVKKSPKAEAWDGCSQ